MFILYILKITEIKKFAGKISDGTNGDVATNFYNFYKVQLDQ